MLQVMPFHIGDCRIMQQQVFRTCLAGFILTFSLFLYACNSTATVSMPDKAVANECVILLHGLARTSASMQKMQQTLTTLGYTVANVDYPSRQQTIDVLAAEAIPRGLQMCRNQDAAIIHLVTHSMGGILIRQYLSEMGISNLGRVVMLAPPNHGSEVVDALRDVPGYHFLNGPAGLQLGTGGDSVPLQLGPVSVDVAVIAGTRSVNLALSTYLPNPDDGKVSVASARLDGMCAMLSVAVSHTFILQDDDVIAEVAQYLTSGRFSSDSAEYPDCGHRFEGSPP